MKKKHCLSGVGQTIQVARPGGGSDGGYVAPRDPEKAVLGEPAKDDVRLTKIYDERYMAWWTHSSWGWIDWRDLPLGVHMSCWKVAQLILGPSIEDNLELSAAIALQNARELIKPDDYILLQLDCRGRKHWPRIEDLEKKLTNDLFHQNRGLVICIPRSVTRTGRPR